jgi:excisionase family DNA binding protein
MLYHPPSLDSLYFTPAELARLYKVSARTVARWTADGDIAFFKIGQTVRHSLDQVLAFDVSHVVLARSRADKRQTEQLRERLEAIAQELRAREAA